MLVNTTPGTLITLTNYSILSNMIKKFIFWFVCFGLSFLVQAFGWTDQGTAFVWINIGTNVLVALFVIVVFAVAGSGLGEKLGLSVTVGVVTIVLLGVVLFATWIATVLFPVDFAIAFQIMTFGQCLVGDSNSK